MFTNKLRSLLGAVLLTGISAISLSSSVTAEEIIIAQTFISEDVLSQTADLMNQNLPMMIDRDVRWNSASAGPGKNFNYNYTLVNNYARDIDGAMFAQNVRQSFTQEFCTKPSGQMFFQQGVSLNANYYDRDNSLIARVRIDPADCGY